MSIWDWVQEQFWQSKFTNQEEKHLMINQIFDSLEYLNSDPDLMLGMLREAQQTAEQLDEKWWSQFCVHWMLQALLFRKQELEKAEAMAVKAIVEIRKAEYDQFPQRVCLHEDLISIYVNRDPFGNQVAIEKSLVYMEGQVTPDVECWFCLHSLQIDFDINRELWGDAMKKGLAYLGIAHKFGEEHHLIVALNILCTPGAILGEWENLLAWSKEGERLARKSEKDQFLHRLLAWQAVAQLYLGYEKLSKEAYKMAIWHAAQLPYAPSADYYRALTLYEEKEGHYQKAIAWRREQLSFFIGKGKSYQIYRCMYEICRLNQLLGVVNEEDLVLAREAAGWMKGKEKLLIDLEELAK